MKHNLNYEKHAQIYMSDNKGFLKKLDFKIKRLSFFQKLFYKCILLWLAINIKLHSEEIIYLKKKL